MTIAIFLAFVGFTLGLSIFLGRRAKNAGGYFAAHGQVGWFVNGVAFAGDYLSAASFLGICGMIAFSGYDGFLYSIGFLAGWVVALLVIAEPVKKLGKYTFADALNARFASKGITLSVAISTLVVSTFYLIPQMVGAGSLIKPLLGLKDLTLGGLTIPAHTQGVVLVGTIVILIVATAGMVSTTWVQFIKGSLLVVFCAILVAAILAAGVQPTAPEGAVRREDGVWRSAHAPKAGNVVKTSDKYVSAEKDHTGPLGPSQFVDAVSSSTLIQWTKPAKAGEPWTGKEIKGETLLLPGGSALFKGVRSEKWTDHIDFVSLMLALFAGTASLPHILIRYYTVKDAAAARKSTVVGIGAIGFFYCLTLFIGLGAMVCGNLDPSDTNMSAPLLAQRFGELPFAMISAIAFTTVLGTVSGLILAGSGAIAHDLVENVLGVQTHDRTKVLIAKLSAIAIGIVAMVLGILFKNFNASFLVGWAFNVAASANLPALIMILFWRGTTKQGVAASVMVGLLSSLTWLLLSAPAYQNIYNYSPGDAAKAAMVPFSQPAVVTLPLAFITLVLVSLITRGAGRSSDAQLVSSDAR
jgi:cation/acetate symporter